MENKKLDSRNPVDALTIIDNISEKFELKKQEWRVFANSINTLKVFIEINSAKKNNEHKTEKPIK